MVRDSLLPVKASWSRRGQSFLVARLAATHLLRIANRTPTPANPKAGEEPESSPRGRHYMDDDTLSPDDRARLADGKLAERLAERAAFRQRVSGS
jgi:hypothetical protein